MSFSKDCIALILPQKVYNSTIFVIFVAPNQFINQL